MNVRELEHLSEEQRELVLRAPALISVLIGGADGHYDKKEINQAITAVHFRAKQGDPMLQTYYSAVDLNFESVMLHIAQREEGKPEPRAQHIIEQLTKLNDILPKIDRRFAAVLLDDWRYLARSVASASGGFLGYAKISVEESHFTDLEMITYQP